MFYLTVKKPACAGFFAFNVRAAFLFYRRLNNGLGSITERP
jgi:hypothetical protein